MQGGGGSHGKNDSGRQREDRVVFVHSSTVLQVQQNTKNKTFEIVYLVPGIV